MCFFKLIARVLKCGKGLLFASIARRSLFCWDMHNFCYRFMFANICPFPRLMHDFHCFSFCLMKKFLINRNAEWENCILSAFARKSLFFPELFKLHNYYAENLCLTCEKFYDALWSAEKCEIEKRSVVKNVRFW